MPPERVEYQAQTFSFGGKAPDERLEETNHAQMQVISSKAPTLAVAMHSSALIQMGGSVRDRHDEITGHSAKVSSAFINSHRLNNERSRANFDMVVPQRNIVTRL
eukprot:gene11115-7907_t